MRSLLGRFHRPMSRGLVNNMLTMNNLGDGSTLSLDFTTMGGVLDPRLTFTRASTVATYINSNGYVATATTNAPRFDYSPTNIGEPRGLLVEGQGINIATRSDDFAETPADGSNWATSGYTTSFLSTSLPTGSTGNARRMVITSGSGSFRSNGLTVTASTTYTFSFWARNNGGSQARYRVWNATAGSSIVDYNLSSSNYVSLIGGANNTSSTWVRISVTFTTPVGCTSIFVYPCSSDSGTVDLLVWGAQLELGSGASSYIPTGASGVTRNADICYADNISSWYTQGIGTMLFVGRPNQSVARNYVGFSTGLNDPRLLLYGNTATEVILYLQNSTGSNLVFTSGSLTLGSVNRMAATFEQANYACVLNGGTVGTSTTASPAMPSGINRINIGMRNDQFAQFCGHVMQVKYFPTRLSNAQLQALTAP